MDIGQTLLVVLGNTGLCTLIIFLIQRKDGRNKLLRELLASSKRNEKDNCRTQLLLLMSDYPNEVQELMTLAKHYFVDLDGNWYASSIFQKFLSDHGIKPPRWFSGHDDNTHHIEEINYGT